MVKTFKPIKNRRHWLPIQFHIFFSKAFIAMGCMLFLHLGYFGLDFTSFLERKLKYDMWLDLGNSVSMHNYKYLETSILII